MIRCTFENGSPAKLRHVAVHAIAVKEEKILLVKRSRTLSTEPGKWALPGGFLDLNETVVEGALRELHEETGWEGKAVGITWINTRPDRPGDDRQDIAFDVVIAPTTQTGKPDNESSEVVWAPLHALLPYEPLAFDHKQSIALYLTQRKKSFLQPIVY